MFTSKHFFLLNFHCLTFSALFEHQCQNILLTLDLPLCIVSTKSSDIILQASSPRHLPSRGVFENRDGCGGASAQMIILDQGIGMDESALRTKCAKLIWKLFMKMSLCLLCLCELFLSVYDNHAKETRFWTHWVYSGFVFIFMFMFFLFAVCICMKSDCECNISESWGSQWDRFDFSSSNSAAL